MFGFGIFRALAAAVVIVAAAGTAGAVTINFDGGGGVSTDGSLNGLYSTGKPPTTYTAGDYFFTPAKDSNDTKCASGRCLIEENGHGINLITVMTRLDKAAFDLKGFYFALLGNGTDKDNNITVTGVNGAVTKTLSFAINTLFTANSPFATVAFDQCVGGGTDDGHIRKQCGYKVSFGDFFDNMKSITWTAGVSAQTRLDCVVAGAAGTTGKAGSCYAAAAAVPLPAAGFLLVGALGALAALRRRRRAV